MTTAASIRATPRAEASERQAALLEAVGWSVLALVIYWVTGPEATGDVWPALAEAFLDGRLSLPEDRPWLELVPRPDGSQYVPLPPGPALTLLPLAIVTGPGTPFGEMAGNVY